MKPSLRHWILGASLVVSAACAHGGSGDAASALLNTGIALGASAASRASGGCYAACTPGTTCNEKTGLCDTLPCRGACNPLERCEEDGLGGRCVPASQPGGSITVQPLPAPDAPRKVPQ